MPVEHGNDKIHKMRIRLKTKSGLELKKFLSPDLCLAYSSRLAISDSLRSKPSSILLTKTDLETKLEKKKIYGVRQLPPPPTRKDYNGNLH